MAKADMSMSIQPQAQPRTGCLLGIHVKRVMPLGLMYAVKVILPLKIFM